MKITYTAGGKNVLMIVALLIGWAIDLDAHAATNSGGKNAAEEY